MNNIGIQYHKDIYIYALNDYKSYCETKLTIYNMFFQICGVCTEIAMFGNGDDKATYYTTSAGKCK